MLCTDHSRGTRSIRRRLSKTQLFCLLTAVIGLTISARGFSVAQDKKSDKDAAPKPRELKCLETWEEFSNWATSVAFSPDGKTLAAGSHNQVKLFDVATKKLSATWNTGSGYARSLAFLPSGAKLVVGSYQSAAIWDVASGKKDREFGGHRGFVTALAISPDGKVVATACDDEAARLFQIEDGKLIRSFEHDREPVHGIAFSPDGASLATAAGDETRVTKPGTAKLWSLATGQLVQTFEAPTRFATAVAFADNGQKLIVTSADEKVYLFEVESGKPRQFFGGHARPVNCITLTRDGQIAITGSGGRAMGKNELKIWKLADGEILATSDEHQLKIVGVALSPDGKRLATAGYDHAVRLWDVAFLASPAQETQVANTAAAENAATKDGSAKDTAAGELKPLKAGIIGLDTSHVTAFTKSLNSDSPKAGLERCHVVAAYPKGSLDIESSASRIPGYTEAVQKMGVEIVDSVEELVKRVDVVFLETNDGRPHFEQLIPVLKAGKPCFIDKPIAASLTDAVAIFEAAKTYKVPIFSSSSLRFGKLTLAARGGELGKIIRAETSSPASLEKTHPDLFWYGIHGVESLFTVMGTGCESVYRSTTPDGKIEVVGRWSGDRVGIFREGNYAGKAIGEKGEGKVGDSPGYDPMLVEIIKFFRSGTPPVSEAETLEIYAFMEAADESKRQNGNAVTLESVLAKARAEAAKKIADLK